MKELIEAVIDAVREALAPKPAKQPALVRVEEKPRKGQRQWKG